VRLELAQVCNGRPEICRLEQDRDENGQTGRFNQGQFQPNGPIVDNTAKVRLTELEDDAASSGELTANVLDGLNTIRRFCIDEKSSTYFRIDFQDKENHTDQYRVLQELLDLRLLHLVDGSLSDERHAGRRSEVYMLDLSQFSGDEALNSAE
jgi:hypothetical protein